MWTHIFFCTISIFQDKTCLWGEVGRLASAFIQLCYHRPWGRGEVQSACEATRVKRASNLSNYYKNRWTIGPPERSQGRFGVPAHTLRTTHSWGKICKGTEKSYCQLSICRDNPSSSLKPLLTHKYWSGKEWWKLVISRYQQTLSWRRFESNNITWLKQNNVIENVSEMYLVISRFRDKN